MSSTGATNGSPSTTKPLLSVRSHRQLKLTRKASAPVSLKDFSLGINEYQTFCRTRGLSLEPTTPTLKAFVVHLGQTKGVAAIEGCINAICLAFEHVYANIREQCGSDEVQQTIREMRDSESNMNLI